MRALTQHSHSKCATASVLRSSAQRRPGVVLLAVLVVLVLLSLIAYRYSDLMLREYRASSNYHKNAQARAYADSGIQYVMGLLTDPTNNISGLLNDNPYSNPTFFQNHAVTQGNATGYFTFLAPPSASTMATGTGACQYGLIDESSKININAVMDNDPSGTTLYNLLMGLPNMAEDVANSILDWIDPDTTPRQGGAENDYYNGLSTPYNAKNGPLDSMEELLLVQGVTPQFLFGADLNRNGYQDSWEVDDGTVTSTGFDLGWSAYLTIYSREQNVDPNGLALINLNDSTIDLQTMFGALSSALGNDLATFIIMARQIGMSTGGGTAGGATGATAAATTTAMAGTATAAGGTAGGGTAGGGGGKGGGGGGGNSSVSVTQAGVLSGYTIDFTKAAKNQISSLFSLVSGTVSITTTSTAGGRTTITTTIYTSPLSDPNQQANLLPLLFQTVTVFAATEIPARINVNTASLEVLTALAGLSGGISTADVQAIQTAQPVYGAADAPDPIYQTPAWLITNANITPSKLVAMEPYITTRSQVYRVQSLGCVDQTKGPFARVEAVIDANLVSVNGALAGQPRILYYRDLGDFGRMRPPQ